MSVLPDRTSKVDIRAGNPYPSNALSNFAAHPFVFRGVECASMEGLLQSLKFKNPEMQKEICTLSGLTAKRAGGNKNWQRTQTLWWQGEPLKRGGKPYQTLLDEAYRALFTQNEKARKALLSTRDATLTHSIGRTKVSDTILTRREFCYRLMTIRRELQVSEFVS